jgi:hypothetical protein
VNNPFAESSDGSEGAELEPETPELEAPVEESEAGEPEPEAEKPKAEAAEEKPELPSHPLFAEPSLEDSDEDEEDGGDDEDDDSEPEVEEKDGKKHVSLQTFRKRVGRLTKQRRAAEGDANFAKSELKRVKAIIEPFAGVLVEKYKGKPQQLRWDVDFIDTAEELAKAGNRTVAEAANIIIEAMKKKGKNTVSTTEKTEALTDTKPEAKPSAPASNPAFEKKIARDAKATVAGVLRAAKVDDRFVNLISAATSSLSLEEQAELDEDGAVTFAKKYLKKNGLKVADILPGKPKEEGDPKKGAKAKPATTGQGRANTTSSESADEEGASTPTYKSREELDAARKKRLREAVRSLSA